MLAAPLGRPVGLGEAWEVLGTWSGEVGGGPDEPRAGVAGRRGHAVPCPGCGVPCGARDARERTWRHPGVWQSGTCARRAVPRTDRPGHGAGTVPVPWEVRPNSRLAALLGDRALAARARGSTAEAADGALGEDDRRLWDMLGRAVAQARGSATTRAPGARGTGETSRSRGHTYIPAMLGPGGGRCARRGRRRRPGTAPRTCDRTRGPRRRQGGTGRRPLPRHAAPPGGDGSRRVPRARGVRREARGARAHQARVARARGEPGGATAGGARGTCARQGPPRVRSGPARRPRRCATSTTARRRRRRSPCSTGSPAG